MPSHKRIGELVIDTDDISAIARILPTFETKEHIELCLKNGRVYSVYAEGSPSYAALAQWLRNTPEFEVPHA